jgi:hypothetical protein
VCVCVCVRVCVWVCVCVCARLVTHLPATPDPRWRANDHGSKLRYRVVACHEADVQRCGVYKGWWPRKACASEWHGASEWPWCIKSLWWQQAGATVTFTSRKFNSKKGKTRLVGCAPKRFDSYMHLGSSHGTCAIRRPASLAACTPRPCFYTPPVHSGSRSVKLHPNVP